MRTIGALCLAGSILIKDEQLKPLPIVASAALLTTGIVVGINSYKKLRSHPNKPSDSKN